MRTHPSMQTYIQIHIISYNTINTLCRTYCVKSISMTHTCIDFEEITCRPPEKHRHNTTTQHRKHAHRVHFTRSQTHALIYLLSYDTSCKNKQKGPNSSASACRMTNSESPKMRGNNGHAMRCVSTTPTRRQASDSFFTCTNLPTGYEQTNAGSRSGGGRREDCSP
jgi:hypothetical protein